MKTLRHFLVFLALTFTAIAHAVTEDVTVSTTGYGDSYQKAVATALLEAVSQVRGVNIATDKTLKSDFEAYATDNASYAKSQTQVVQDISVQTKGQVKSYQITFHQRAKRRKLSVGSASASCRSLLQSDGQRRQTLLYCCYAISFEIGKVCCGRKIAR
jgi:hypothetical protein